MIKPIGINIKVEGASWDVIGGKMHSEAVLMGWGSHNPFEMYNIYASENSGVEYNNTGFYSNETVDGYFKQAIRAKSEEEAIEFWKKRNGMEQLVLVEKVMQHGHGW